MATRAHSTGLKNPLSAPLTSTEVKPDVSDDDLILFVDWIKYNTFKNCLTWLKIQNLQKKCSRRRPAAIFQKRLPWREVTRSYAVNT